MSRDCIYRLVEASRGKDGEALLSERQAGDLLDEIKKAATKNTTDGMDLTDAVLAEIAAMKVNKKIEGQIQRRNAAKNILIDRGLRAKRDALVAEGLSPRKALQSMLVGVEGLYQAGRSSVAAKVLAVQRRYFGSFVNELEQSNLLKIVHEKGMQEEIERELYHLSSTTPREAAVARVTGKTVSGSKEAFQIAKIIHKYQEQVRLRQNTAGAYIDKLDGYTSTQDHDRAAMRKVGFDRWREIILPLLDKQRTFAGADPDEFLRSTYEVLTTGVSKRQQADEKLFEFKGPANLAKKISKKRVLHFENADASIAYRAEFGKMSFIDSVFRSIENGSRNIALMETFGTNPRAMFERLHQDTLEKYRGDPKAFKGLENQRAIRNFYDEVDGSTLIPEVPSLATFGSIARALQSASKLGGVIISSITDIPIKAAELQHQGYGIADSYGIGFKDIRLISKERKELGEMLIGYGQGAGGAISSRWSAQDDLPGSVSKMMRLFFKLNGLTWWTDSQKIGTSMAMSRRLAGFKGLAFEQLDADTQRLFKNYDITPEDWGHIRSTVVKQSKGDSFLIPDAIRDLDLPETYKNDLEDKLRGYFIDRVDYAVLTPSARENAVLHQGFKRGTIEGEFARTITQFKSFPTTFLSKIYGRAIYGRGKLDIPSLVQTTIMTTLFGYMALAGKDLVKGRKPRPLEDPKTYLASYLQGGGFGIAGDFVFGEYNRYGQSFTSTVMGPTFGTADDLAKLWASARNGDDVAAKTLNFAVRNAPFANIFYLKPVLDHMALYQLQERLNPGYLRRMERRVKKENNQEFLIKPSSSVGR